MNIHGVKNLHFDVKNLYRFFNNLQLPCNRRNVTLFPTLQTWKNLFWAISVETNMYMLASFIVNEGTNTFEYHCGHTTLAICVLSLIPVSGNVLFIFKFFIKWQINDPNCLSSDWLVIPRKRWLRVNMTEKIVYGTLSIKQKKKKQKKKKKKKKK